MRLHSITRQFTVVSLCALMTISSFFSVFANPVVTSLDGDVLAEAESSIYDPILTYEKPEGSLKITIDFSDEYKELLTQNGCSSISVKLNVRYPWQTGNGSAINNLTIYCQAKDNFVRNYTVLGVPESTDAEITLTKASLGSWDREMNYQTTTRTHESAIKGEVSFTTDNPLENNNVYYANLKLKLTEGFQNGHTYKVNLYTTYVVNEYVGITPKSVSSRLNASNNYMIEESHVFSYEPEEEKKAWVYIQDTETNGMVYMGEYSLDTPRADYSDLLTVSAKDITYTTARLYVTIKDFTAFEGSKLKIETKTEEINQRPLSGNCGYNPYYVTPTNPQTMITVHKLGPGQTYKVYLDIENEAGKKYTSVATGFEFSTPEYQEFKAFTGPVEHTKEELRQEWNRLTINMGKEDKYEKSVDHITGGVLDNATLQNAVDIVNMIRYAAGLPDDVMYDTGNSSIVNAGCELNRLNGVLTHYPEKPSKVSEDFYNRGYIGTSSSNLYVGPSTQPDAIVGWMEDGGKNNISNGHRGWILEPGEAFVGFGASGYYRGLYVFNYRYFRDVNAQEPYYFTWPAKYTPVELYTENSSDYSNSLYTKGYDTIDKEKIQITVKDMKTGKTTVLKQSDYSREPNSKYWYTTGTQLIFYTSGYSKGDKISVHVDGTTIGGESAPIDYTMEFFSIKDVSAPEVKVESVQITNPVTEMHEGEQKSFCAKVLPDNATDQEIVWSVESMDGNGDGDITKEGVFTALIDGKVKITAASKSSPEISDSFELEITKNDISASEIVLSRENMTLYEGESGYIHAVVKPYNATNTDIIFHSSAPEKVTALDGTIKALEETDEPVTIAASVENSDGTVISKNCMVTVLKNNTDYDKNYSSGLYDLRLDSDTEVKVGETTIVKVYPAFTGASYDRENCSVEMTGGPCVEIRRMSEGERTDDGYWFEVKGLSKGNAQLKILATMNYGEGTEPEVLSKKCVLKVVDAPTVVKEAEPVISLLTKNANVNVHKEQGVLLDIRNPYTTESTKVPVLTSADGSHNRFELKKESDGNYYLHAKSDTQKGKYNLNVDFSEGRGEQAYALKCTVANTFPKTKTKQNTVFDTSDEKGTVRVSITGKEPIESVDWSSPSSTLEITDVSYDNEKTLTVTLSRKDLTENPNFSGCLNVLYKGYRDASPVPLRLKVKDLKTKKNTLVLNQSKVTICAADEKNSGAVVAVAMKNSEATYPDRVIVKSADNKSADAIKDGLFSFSYSKNTGRLNIKPMKELTAQSLKFAIEAYVVSDGKREKAENTAILTVSVVNKEATLSLKATGKMDLLCRDTACVILTPKMKNVSGQVQSAVLDEASAKLFRTVVDTKGRILLRARKGAGLVPKQKYEVTLDITMNNGMTFQKSVPVKPTQSSVKVNAPKNATLYINQKEDVSIPIAVKSPAGGSVAKIDTISIPRGLSYQNGALHITDRTLLRPGKYNLQLSVIPSDAHKSVKPATVKVKLTVK